MPRCLPLAPHRPDRALERRYRQSRDPVARPHWQMLWLVAQGHTCPAVATLLGSKEWVRTIVHRLDADERRESKLHGYWPPSDRQSDNEPGAVVTRITRWRSSRQMGGYCQGNYLARKGVEASEEIETKHHHEPEPGSSSDQRAVFGGAGPRPVSPAIPKAGGRASGGGRLDAQHARVLGERFLDVLVPVGPGVSSGVFGVPMREPSCRERHGTAAGRLGRGTQAVA